MSVTKLPLYDVTITPSAATLIFIPSSLQFVSGGSITRGFKIVAPSNSQSETMVNIQYTVSGTDSYAYSTPPMDNILIRMYTPPMDNTLLRMSMIYVFVHSFIRLHDSPVSLFLFFSLSLSLSLSTQYVYETSIALTLTLHLPLHSR